MFRSTGRAPDGEALDVDVDDPDRAIDVDTNKYRHSIRLA